MKNRNKKIIKWVLVLFGVLLFGLVLFHKTVLRILTTQLVRHNGIKIKGVIIREENYMGNSPVSHAFSYSYRILVDDKTYQNDSHDPDLNIGDSIEVIYVKFWPFLNKPAH